MRRRGLLRVVVVLEARRRPGSPRPCRPPPAGSTLPSSSRITNSLPGNGLPTLPGCSSHSCGRDDRAAALGRAVVLPHLLGADEVHERALERHRARRRRVQHQLQAREVVAGRARRSGRARMRWKFAGTMCVLVTRYALDDLRAPPPRPTSPSRRRSRRARGASAPSRADPSGTSGPTARCTSSGPRPHRSPPAATPAARRRKSSSPIATPFGRPVVPDVYAIDRRPAVADHVGRVDLAVGRGRERLLVAVARPRAGARRARRRARAAGLGARRPRSRPSPTTTHPASSALKCTLTGTTIAPSRPAPCSGLEELDASSGPSPRPGRRAARRAPCSACATRRARSSSSA